MIKYSNLTNFRSCEYFAHLFTHLFGRAPNEIASASNLPLWDGAEGRAAEQHYRLRSLHGRTHYILAQSAAIGEIYADLALLEPRGWLWKNR